MAEEVADNTETQDTETVQESVSIIGDDGKFVEGWKDSLDEGIRHEKCLDTVDSVPAMAKMMVHGQKMIGRDKVVLPTDNSTQVEWDEFYKQLGRPETVDDYEIDIPAELTEHVDPNMLQEAKTIFHAAGLNQKQATALMDFEKMRIANGLKAVEDQAVAEKALAEKTLREKWGTAYDEKLHLANRMIAENTNDESKDAVLTAVGNNSHVADFLATIATKFIEGGVIDGTTPGKSTPTEAKAQAEALRSTPGYMDGQLKKTNPVMYDRITEEITELFKQVYPEPGS